MKIFISWSGIRSKLVAELINDWIKGVIQSVEPWFSPDDIDRGALWFTNIAEQLASTSTGIVCLTRENYERPWILFEAGALTKGLTSSRVLTLLIDLEGSELQSSPLAAFNHSTPDKEGMRKLLRTINSRTEKPLDIKTLDQVFELFWPTFEDTFKQIIDRTESSDAKPTVEPTVSQSDIVSLINSVKELQWSIINNNVKPKDNVAPKYYGGGDDAFTSIYRDMPTVELGQVWEEMLKKHYNYDQPLPPNISSVALKKFTEALKKAKEKK